MDMDIEIVKVGDLECNCYLLVKDNKVLLIDPGDEGDKIINKVGNRKVVGIIITHYHYDHVGALNDIVSRYNIPVYDRSNLFEGKNKIDKFVFDVIYTPGHKEEAITVYFKEDKCMFCGDFIFKDSIGRCDLPGGNIDDMKNSINKIKKYDHDIVIYPGHGEKTNLGYEVEKNLYFLHIDML